MSADIAASVAGLFDRIAAILEKAQASVVRANLPSPRLEGRGLWGASRRLEGTRTGLEGARTGLEGTRTGLEGARTGLEGTRTGLEGAGAGGSENRPPHHLSQDLGGGQ